MPISIDLYSVHNSPKPMSNDEHESTLPEQTSDEQDKHTTLDYIDSGDELIEDSLELSDDEWVLSLIASQLPKREARTKDSEQRNETKQEQEVEKKIVKVAIRPSFDEDDEIFIPAVFTTQGTKNSKLLKQSEEIDRQLTGEEARMKAQAEELASLRANILDELNDNGTMFRYSLRNDGELVEKNVQQVYAKDHLLETHRHFFYFDDILQSDNIVFNESVDLLFKLMTLQWHIDNHANLVEILRHNGISMEEVVAYACQKVYDETLLDLVERFVVYASDFGPDHVPFERTDTNSSGSSITQRLKGLGARIQPTQLLKLVHYNNNARILILKLCIVFHYNLTKQIDELEIVVKHFLLSMSDFILNKREKELLLTKFVGPVFHRIISVCNDNDKMIILVENVINGLNTHIYGTEKGSELKDHELHYNIVHNVWIAFCQESGNGRDVAELLILNYLKFSENDSISYSVVDLALVVTKIGKTKVCPINRSPIYKNIYRAHISTSLLTNLIYGQRGKNKHEYFSLQQSLLDCKDHLQESIGRLLYMSLDELPDKVLLSTALSETYHVIDQFTSVLDKNIIFLKRDFFYNE